MFTARQPPPSQEDWPQLLDTSNLQEVWILYVSREWFSWKYRYIIQQYQQYITCTVKHSSCPAQYSACPAETVQLHRAEEL